MSILDSGLVNQSCVPCSGDVEALNLEDAEALLAELVGWNLHAESEVLQLQKMFTFKDFHQALLFAVRVGDIADQMNHHPLLSVEWGKVSVRWWTHKINGLHRNDFILAAKTDAAYRPE